MEAIIYSKEHKKLIEQIVRARKESGLSQVKAAKLLNKSRVHVKSCVNLIFKQRAFQPDFSFLS